RFLQNRVQRFGREHKGDGQQKDEPLNRRDPEQPAQSDCADTRRNMNSEIRLGKAKQSHATTRTDKAHRSFTQPNPKESQCETAFGHVTPRSNSSPGNQHSLLRIAGKVGLWSSTARGSRR